MLKNIALYTGLILMTLGVATIESEKMLIPALMAISGAIIVFIVANTEEEE